MFILCSQTPLKMFWVGMGPMVEYFPSTSNTQDSVLDTENQKCYNIFNSLSSPSSVNAEGFYVAPEALRCKTYCLRADFCLAGKLNLTRTPTPSRKPTLFSAILDKILAVTI